jgi:hypothetical protein
MNLSELRARARDLTGVYSTDLVSDTLLTAWINEVYDKVGRLYAWPWLGSKVPLSAATDVPAWSIRDFDVVLAYLAAIRILETQADDTQRGQAYTAIAGDLVQDMFTEFLTGAETPSIPSTRAQLRQYLRNLMKEYTDSYSDATLNQFLNEAYAELSREKDWTWLEQVQTNTLNAGVTTFTLTNGNRRVLEMDIIDPNGSKEVKQVPVVYDVDPSSSTVYYDVSNSGVVTIAPAQTTQIEIKTRYIPNYTVLTSDSSVPAFDANFAIILVYRAAVKLATLAGDAKKREIFVAEYTTLVGQFISYYQNDHDTTPLQLGAESLVSRKYLPWFRS